ncbi:uncharacterized protein LOC125229685 [Leguminivora glycinivorella]|uniref:uncharacterized protein LOC125229685 n=1 Tax=Leguminivora glycinivorella TaxID=1035111 RepID=UPI00200E4029|nr:uncharacterized protein LOC125229685 [Leguminivora glycinivorella]
MSKKTTFNCEWQLNDKFKPWLEPVKNDHFSAYCKLCKKSFTLSNMGEQALSSHMKGKKHNILLSNQNKSMSLKSFYSEDKKEPVSKEPITTTSPDIVVESAGQVTPSHHNNIKEKRVIMTMLIKDEITKAEIIWCMYQVLSHSSQRSGGQAVDLFPLMFPDSDIAKKMRLQRTKIAYTVLYGLAPYFFRQLKEECCDCDVITIGFDESLNKVAQKGQMDIFVRYWDNEKNQVRSRYYGSAFLGHATADDLLKAFLATTDGIDTKKILQVSMDGPNVNKKFLQDLKSKLKNEGEAGDPILLNMGSCGLHNLHNAFKKSMKASGWKVVDFLRSLYYLFCYSPARREDYTRFSGSSTFPLKFCAVRWLENFSVVDRATKIIPNVEKYVKGIKNEKKHLTAQALQ